MAEAVCFGVRAKSLCERVGCETSEEAAYVEGLAVKWWRGATWAMALATITAAAATAAASASP